tara:strand:+ start:2682 stop:5075 length:2394 start_codon:yes stop_codon:yes gene_type:complete
MGRTIQSPGVEINEIDLSLRPNIATGTTVLVTGFADKGPSDEVIQVTSLSEFEQIYGVPTTPAERYFYHTVKPIFNSQANILTYRLPYGLDSGAGFGNSYGVLAYPVRGTALSSSDSTTLCAFDVNTFTQPATTVGGINEPIPVVYTLGKPVHHELTETQYNKILRGEGFSWNNTMATGAGALTAFTDLGGAGMLVLNKGQTTVNTKFEGFYFGAIDNSNINDVTDYDGIMTTETVTSSAAFTTSYVTLPEKRLGFSLSGSNNALTNTFGQEDDSVSELMENLAPFDLSTRLFDDTLSIGLFKLRQSVFASDVIKLDYVLSESYVGSFDYHRQKQSQTGGSAQSFFIGTKEDQSPNISIMVNENLSHKNGNTWRNLDGIPVNKIRLARGLDSTNWYKLSSTYLGPNQSGLTIHKSVSAQLSAAEGGTKATSLFTIGTYSTPNARGLGKDLGSIPKKLDRLLDTVENPDIYDLDITVEGGLGTINAARKENGGDKYFDDTATVELSSYYTSDPTSISNTTYRDNWKTIYNKFNNFAEKRRKDHLFIADLPRPIFVQGTNYKTLQDPNKNYSLNIGAPIKAFTSILNSSYATTYACWSKVYDAVLDDQCWVPFSGTAAELMANTDANFQPWFAPAGFTRGRVGSVNDIVLYPKQKQRDNLYKNSVNPVAFFPGDGFTVFGQKTLQAAPTAFDRINVRRLFLNLEKSTRKTVKYFVFEPNTLLTRTRVINTLTPIFERAKNTEGLYDYLIVCDERNNTPDVIDQNELIIDIYLKPVRAAEFILVNFYATRTGTDFNEIVG